MEKKLLGIIAIAISAVSLLLNIIGLAIPNWLYYSLDVHGVTATSKIGLWKICGLDNCSALPDVSVTSSLKGTRALELLGMILLIGALACAVLKLLVMKGNALLPKVAGACAGLAGVFMIIGSIIFAAKYKKDIAKFDYFLAEFFGGDFSFSDDLHAGFALCIVAGVGSIVSAVMFVINKEA